MIYGLAGATGVATLDGAPPGQIGHMEVSIRRPDNTVAVAPSTVGVAEVPAGSGSYQATLVWPSPAGRYIVVWDVGDGDPTHVATEVLMVSGSTPPMGATDIAVMVPRVRRFVEGPLGASGLPPGVAALSAQQLYDLTADSLAEIVLITGGQRGFFGHQILVTGRDPVGLFPTTWATEVMLGEDESVVVACQAALNYFFHAFRGVHTAQAVKNEGTEYTYELGVGVITSQLKMVQAARDMALLGLRLEHPIIDRFNSNIRVRDQATVAILEWWDVNSLGIGGSGGMPGGQEAAVIPWTPGYSN